MKILRILFLLTGLVTVTLFWNGFLRAQLTDGEISLDFTPVGVENSSVTVPNSSNSFAPRFSGPLSNVYWESAEVPKVAYLVQSEPSYYGNNVGYGSVVPREAQGYYLAQATPGSMPEFAPLGSLSPATNPPPPGATFSGPYTAPGGDPYIAPGTTTPGTPPASGSGSGFGAQVGNTYSEAKRFLDRLMVEYYFAPKSGGTPLGINDFLFQSRFAVPCQHLGNTFVYVTPSFELTLFNHEDFQGNNHFALSKQAYGAWLDAGIEPRLSDKFRFDLYARVGIFSDFKKFSSDSIRILGRGQVYYQLNDRMELAVGVMYLDRERYKMLPTGGLIWCPSDTVEWRIVFPDPKFSKLFSQVNNTQWWWFVRGNYGGNCWSFKMPDGSTQRVDYNDIRISIGMEFRNPNTTCADGYLEFGGLFNRELYSEGNKIDPTPSSGVFFGAGLYY